MSVSKPSPSPFDPRQKTGAAGPLPHASPFPPSAASPPPSGPPGTGKTTTIRGILSEFLRTGPVKRALVCAPSNKAVQELCARFTSAHGDIPAVLISADESLPDQFVPLTPQGHVRTRLDALAAQLQCWAGAGAAAPPELEEALEALRRCVPNFLRAHWTGAWPPGPPSPAVHRALLAAVGGMTAALAQGPAAAEAELEALRGARVVFCTLSVAGRAPLKGHLHSDLLVIDEAAQCVEPESLIGIAAAQATHCVLVGDPLQLPATVLSPTAADRGLGRSLMERLMQCGQPCTRLTLQYRMHPNITQLPNSLFYRGELEDDVSVQSGRRDCNWSDRMRPLAPLGFIDVVPDVPEAKVGHSFENTAEAQLLVRLVDYFTTRCAVRQDQIGVLTFYSAQVCCCCSCSCCCCCCRTWPHGNMVFDVDNMVEPTLKALQQEFSRCKAIAAVALVFSAVCATVAGLGAFGAAAVGMLPARRKRRRGRVIRCGGISTALIFPKFG